MIRRTTPFPAGPAIFRSAFRKLRLKPPVPAFEVEFFPYSTLTHTIRLRGGLAFVRLAAVMGEAPRSVLEALATLLLARLYRRRLPNELSSPYLNFLRCPRLRRRLAHHRRRTLKRFQPVGRVYDLGKIFSRLNRIYFHGRLRRPHLGWTGRQARTLLGRYDPAPQAITISSFLDRQEVPAHVLEFVLFHEMLHMAHRGRLRRHRSHFHTSEFRRAEKRFRHHAAAEAYLRRLL